MDKVYPKPNKTKADERLQQRLQHGIEQLNVPALRFVSVEVRGGVVLLRGRVHTWHQRQIVNAACRRLVGAENLIDLLVVDETSAPLPSLPATWAGAPVSRSA